MSPQSPRVFISYAWETAEYRLWVKRLATRLRADGVNARLDAWHLGDTDRVPAFMNREIRQAERVLVLCSPAYRSKVHATEDGEQWTCVGWEAGLLSGQILALNKNKVVVALARGTWSEAAPDSLLGERYDDLSNAQFFEDRYLALLRRLIGASEQPPPLGTLPANLEPEPVEPLRGPTPAQELPVPDPTLPAPPETGRPAHLLPWAMLVVFVGSAIVGSVFFDWTKPIRDLIGGKSSSAREIPSSSHETRDVNKASAPTAQAKTGRASLPDIVVPVPAPRRASEPPLPSPLKKPEAAETFRLCKGEAQLLLGGKVAVRLSFHILGLDGIDEVGTASVESPGHVETFPLIGSGARTSDFDYDGRHYRVAVIAVDSAKLCATFQFVSWPQTEPDEPHKVSP